MAAKKGNKYAEKWTLEEVKRKLNEMVLLLSEDKESEILFIGQLLSTFGLYREIWAYWSNKFGSDMDVFNAIKGIEQVFENRIYTKALRGEIVASVAIFGLKNNHKWTDKSQVDVTSNGETLPIVGMKILADGK